MGFFIVWVVLEDTLVAAIECWLLSVFRESIFIEICFCNEYLELSFFRAFMKSWIDLRIGVSYLFYVSTKLPYCYFRDLILV